MTVVDENIGIKTHKSLINQIEDCEKIYLLLNKYIVNDIAKICMNYLIFNIKDQDEQLLYDKYNPQCISVECDNCNYAKYELSYYSQYIINGRVAYKRERICNRNMQQDRQVVLFLKLNCVLELARQNITELTNSTDVPRPIDIYFINVELNVFVLCYNLKSLSSIK